MAMTGRSLLCRHRGGRRGDAKLPRPATRFPILSLRDFHLESDERDNIILTRDCFPDNFFINLLNKCRALLVTGTLLVT